MIIQVAELKTMNSVQLVDISAEKRGNHFLKHCRMPYNGGINHLRSEYLIPSFVAQCCKKCDYDGIKFFGTKVYSNYVTWEDKHFIIVNANAADSNTVRKKS